MPGLLTIYRDLHRHPELSSQENPQRQGHGRCGAQGRLTVTEKVGRTGVVEKLGTALGV